VNNNNLDRDSTSDEIHADYMNCPFRVTFDGAMYSTSGSIGGWTID
jgi:hypothetical protein